MPVLTQCELDEESSELSELRSMVEEYDELFEYCMIKPLANDEQELLDSLYFELSLKENTYWDGASPFIFEMFVDKTNLDFPMIRYTLGILPER